MNCRSGSLMMCALILIDLCSQGVEAESIPNPNPSECVEPAPGIKMVSDKIPFQLKYNKVVLPGEIGASSALRLLLDTGMQSDGILIYNPDVRDSIELIKPFSAAISGAGSQGPAGAVFSDSMAFRIAGVEFSGHRIIMLQGDGFRGFPSDGVIGYSLLGHYAVEVDYDRSTIVLHDPEKPTLDNSWTSIPMFFKENKTPWIKIDITVEKSKPVELACYIDSASAETVECLIRPEQTFNLPEKTEPVYLGRGLSGDIMGSRGMIDKVRIGPFELENLTAAFASADHRSKQPGADGVIGGGLLKHFNLVYDYANLKLYLKLRESIPTDTPLPTAPATPIL